jgi:hypothetical protein
MRFLRRGTAVNLTVGPAYDKTDGVTPETDLTFADERITFAIQSQSTAAAVLPLNNQAGSTSDSTHTLDYLSSAVGLLRLRLTSSDVSTQGSAMLIITNTTSHVPIFHEFVVLEETRYDALVAASTTFAANVASFGATPLLQLGVVGQGTAQQSSSNSLTLASTMVYATDEINGATLLVTSGTGVGQARTVLGYNSTSKIATVDAYVTTPSSVATYALFGTPPSSPTSPIVANVTQWNGAVVATPSVSGVPEVDLTYIGGVAQASTSAQVGVHVVSAASTAVTASVDSTGIANDVLNSTVEGTITLRQMQRGLGAVLLGLVSGSSGSTTVFRDAADMKTRVTAITDSNGNRTSITLDLT